jgi:hypothetical protein
MVNVPQQVIDIQYPYANSSQVKQTDVKICSTILLMGYRHYCGRNATSVVKL